MRFKDLFNKDMTPNYKKIQAIKEFSVLKSVSEDKLPGGECGESIKFSVYDHTEKIVSEMTSFLDKIGVEKDTEHYLVMMSAALCHDIGKTTPFTTMESGVNGSNICRKLFYDDDTFIREKVCYIVRNFPCFLSMFTNDTLVRTIMKLSWGLATVKDFLILYWCNYRAVSKEYDKQDLTDKMEYVVKMSNDIKCYTAPYDFDSAAQKNEFFYQVPDSSYNKKGKRFTVYIMVGLPGAGKDTYISKKLNGVPTVCRDDIRTEIGIKGSKPQGTKKEEELVTNIVNERIVDFCEKRTSFIINNTNLKKEYRDSFEKMILPYKPKIVFIYVEAPNVTENKNRRSGQIQPSVIERMSKSLDFPEPYEYDEIRYDIQR